MCKTLIPGLLLLLLGTVGGRADVPSAPLDDLIFADGFESGNTSAWPNLPGIPFDYPSPTLVVGSEVTSGGYLVKVFVLTPAPSFQTLFCPSAGVIGKICDEIEPGDSAGFEGFVPISDNGPGPLGTLELTAVVVDLGRLSFRWSSTARVRSIDDGRFELDDDTAFYCPSASPSLLYRVCQRLDVGDRATFKGNAFPGDADLAGELQLKLIWAVWIFCRVGSRTASRSPRPASALPRPFRPFPLQCPVAGADRHAHNLRKIHGRFLPWITTWSLVR